MIRLRTRICKVILSMGLLMACPWQLLAQEPALEPIPLPVPIPTKSGEPKSQAPAKSEEPAAQSAETPSIILNEPSFFEDPVLEGPVEAAPSPPAMPPLATPPAGPPTLAPPILAVPAAPPAGIPPSVPRQLEAPSGWAVPRPRHPASVTVVQSGYVYDRRRGAWRVVSYTTVIPSPTTGAFGNAEVYRVTPDGTHLRARSAHDPALIIEERVVVGPPEGPIGHVPGQPIRNAIRRRWGL